MESLTISETQSGSGKYMVKSNSQPLQPEGLSGMRSRGTLPAVLSPADYQPRPRLVWSWSWPVYWVWHPIGSRDLQPGPGQHADMGQSCPILHQVPVEQHLWWSASQRVAHPPWFGRGWIFFSLPSQRYSDSGEDSCHIQMESMHSPSSLPIAMNQAAVNQLMVTLALQRNFLFSLSFAWSGLFVIVFIKSRSRKSLAVKSCKSWVVAGRERWKREWELERGGPARVCCVGL